MDCCICTFRTLESIHFIRLSQLEIVIWYITNYHIRYVVPISNIEISKANVKILSIISWLNRTCSEIAMYQENQDDVLNKITTLVWDKKINHFLLLINTLMLLCYFLWLTMRNTPQTFPTHNIHIKHWLWYSYWRFQGLDIIYD